MAKQLSIFLFCLILSSFISLISGASPDQWRGRTIYQLLTDRFAQNSDGGGECAWLGGYCGGTWNGIINHLDYIQGMGFDAIWITPIPKNTPGGYHGYWQQDFTQVNPHFGSSADLQRLVRECHNRGIWVMLDVVANHVGPVNYDYSTIVPFNQPAHYHGCGSCPSNCQIQDFNNQPQVEMCRLAGLPDLDQSNTFVRTTLVQWIKNAVANYSFDGIRIDTSPEVPKDFWASYVKASGVYSVGEVYNGDVGYVSSYQSPKGPLSGVLSYPLFFTLRNVFAYKQSMWQLQTVTQQYQSNMGDVGLLGTFIDNHDQTRFLHETSDVALYKSAIVYTLLSTGIPIIYYGTEQGFNGASDPNNREVLWTTNYNTNTDLYKYISTVVNFRKKSQVWTYPQVQRYADDNFYAFTRGNILVALTNNGSQTSNHVLVTVTFHPYKNGQKLCNLFFPDNDCFVVENGEFDIYLEDGEAKIYYPVSS